MGPMVNDRQVLLYRKKRMEGKTQEAAAAASSMTAKTARKWDHGPLPSTLEPVPRSWRTRTDPFDEVWESEVVPLLKTDDGRKLQAKTVLQTLTERYPEQFSAGQVRTLQRRVRGWRALYGPGKEVFFEQVHPMGVEAQFDFTDASKLGITICGAPLNHLIFEFILSYSKWRWGAVAFGETFEAMASCLQDAAWDLGGTTATWRSDNLSAATHQLKRDNPERGLTKRYKALVEHYDVRSTRIKPGKSNENGVVEKGHDTLKNALEQALIVRLTRDFPSLDAYRAFVQSIVDNLNAPTIERLEEERACLKPLPSSRVPAFTDVHARVHRSSCIRVGNNTYMVPSRLIGEEVVARTHPDHVEVFYGGKTVDSFPRLRGEGKHHVNYRYIIDSLVAKPGAFAGYRYREELFPGLAFRQAYDTLVAARGCRAADLEYLRILQLAARTMESEVDLALQICSESKKCPEYAEIQALVQPGTRDQSLVVIGLLEPDLDQYNDLLNGANYAQDPDFTATVTS